MSGGSGGRKWLACNTKRIFCCGLGQIPGVLADGKGGHRVSWCGRRIEEWGRARGAWVGFDGRWAGGPGGRQKSR